MSEEPVAYLQLDIHGEEMVHIEKDMSGYETKPLYTKAQIQPKVKMTQAEFDEFNELFIRHTSISGSFMAIYNTNLYPRIKNLILSDDPVESSKNELSFAKLFYNYDPDNPEETIEIVPTKKWFVRSKEKSEIEEDNRYSWLYDINERYPDYISSESNQSAIRFDTKEDAERWVNPLTEAVLLPVDGE